ncbi:MAG TPA: hypothetical protein VND45_10240 [Thermoanaerobaculia bacterium]|nr:hypothetical protein [Thermoanaerobaculia bacterium]
MSKAFARGRLRSAASFASGLRLRGNASLAPAITRRPIRARWRSAVR